MSALGRVRRRKHINGEVRYYLDLRPYSTRIYSDSGEISFRDESHARAVLERIRTRLAGGLRFEEAVTPYLPASAQLNQVEAKLALWLRVKRQAVEAGDLSPTYLRPLERYCQSEGHFGWWHGRSLSEIRYATLEDWTLWLAERRDPRTGQRLSGKTRRNVVGARVQGSESWGRDPWHQDA